MANQVYSKLFHREVGQKRNNAFAYDVLRLGLSRLAVSHIHKDPGPSGCVFCLQYSPDGQTLLIANGAYLHLLDADTMQPMHSLEGHSDIITAVKWVPSGDKFVSGSLDRALKIVDANKGRVIGHINEHNDWIRCLDTMQHNGTSAVICGYVSSVVAAYDLETLKPLWKVEHAHVSEKYTVLNSVNSVCYAHGNPFIWSSGARDGTIRVWDTRVNGQFVSHLAAHSGKLNVVQIAKNDVTVMSSGRDSAIRIWDLRCLPDSSRQVGQIIDHKTALIKQFTSHKCVGYNISAVMFGNDRFVATGSEDNHLYVYDIESGDILSKILAASSVVHVVEVHPYTINPKIATSSIDSSNIIIWEPSVHPSEAKLSLKINGNPDQSLFHIHRKAVEMVMSKYGDQLLYLFYKYKIAFGSNWNDVMQNLVQEQHANPDLMNLLSQISLEFAQAFERSAMEAGLPPLELARYTGIQDDPHMAGLFGLRTEEEDYETDDYDSYSSDYDDYETSDDDEDSGVD